jgi:hypothetical protein
MDWSIPVAAFIAFVAGLSVVSKILAWGANIYLALRPSEFVTQPVGLSIAPLVLHSGPWLLVVTVTAVWYIASNFSPALLWSVIGGLTAAILFLSFSAIYAHRRSKQPPKPTEPLTPERLSLIRSRFFRVYTLGFGGSVAAGMLYLYWSQFSQSPFLVGFVIVVSLGGGWIYSWFMWQFYGASLEARESDRIRKERQNGV